VIFTTLYVEKIESAYGVESWAGGTIMTAQQEWKVTATPGTNGGESLTWSGKGECPWRINQKLQVTIAPFPEEDQ